MKAKLLSLSLLLAVLAIPQIASATIQDCMDATCRIETSDTRGTGCCFSIQSGNVFVLTNAHVVGKNPQVNCRFYVDGHESEPLSATVLGGVSNEECDAAVVVLNEAQFAGLLPQVIPIAEADYIVPSRRAVLSVGCSGGAWPTVFNGHAITNESGSLLFIPPPANGRSGSAIFDAVGTKIVGLLFARHEPTATDPVPMYGLAVNVPSLRKNLRTSCNVSAEVMAGPCPGPDCPTPQGPQNRQFGIFNKNTQPGQSPGLPYPSLLPEQRTPQGPSVVADEQARQMATDAMMVAQEAAKAAATAIQTADKAQKAADANDRNLIEKVHDAIWGLAAKYGLWALLAVGVLVFVLIKMVRKDVSDKIATGDPLFIEKVAAKTTNTIDDKLASVVANKLVGVHEKVNQRLDAMDDRIAALRQQIASKANPS